MKAFRVVADSSCLIALAQVKQFELLRQLFSKIYIPEAVYDEVVITGRGEAGSDETARAVKSGWIIKKKINDRVAVSALTTILGRGESEALVLCKEMDTDYALIDEKTARNMAELMNIDTMGTLGIIDLSVSRGFPIDKRKIIGQLMALGFRISDKLYRKIFPDS